MIEVENIRYRYPEGEPVLRGVSFAVAENEKDTRFVRPGTWATMPADDHAEAVGHLERPAGKRP